MSYQVLARKYRPKNFDSLVGQEHVVRALTHALQTQRLHHAYLFTGTRGVGKTTLSRILAKSFNCVGPDGQGDITASPCGVCEVCKAIDAGRFVDYIEMDAASNRGVDEMAQLLEQAVYAPSNARFKVYMIDEVHMLTNTAFNAMLKTLEEPPPHIKFILATTDPQKIPVTVLSRCLQFNLKQMPPGHIISHLEHILGLEQIAFETPALRLLAQGAHGSMRDALSLTDQAIAYAAGKVTLDAVQGMLGALDQSFLLRLLDALAREDGADMLAVADEMATRSLSYNTALQDLASLLHLLALAQTVPQALPDDVPEREEVLRLAQVFDAEEVQLFYQIAVHGRNELGLAPDEYAGFTMSLLRMLAFRPSSGVAGGSASAAAARPASASASVRSVAASVTTAANTPPPRPAAAPPAATSSNANGLAPTMSPAKALQAARAIASGKPTSTASPAPGPVSPVSFAAENTQTVPPWEDAPDWGNDGSAEFFAAQMDAQVATTTPGKMAQTNRQHADAAPPDIPANAEKISSPIVMPAALHAPAKQAVPEFVKVAVPQLQWDGDWPALAASLAVRGVAQQLAMHSELIHCVHQGNAAELQLRLPPAVEIYGADGNIEKLAHALGEHFGLPVKLLVKIEGPVWHTAQARAEAARLLRQAEAEKAVQDDEFVQSLLTEFDAYVVPQSVKPIELAQGA